MARRGSYAKGVAKREEILTRALEVIAREGYRGASVKELAEAVGLSQAGLLHYFGSKDELFTAILRKRDEVDHVAHGAVTGDLDDLRRAYLGILTHNAEVPGLVRLFSALSASAADADHPAHAFFVQRGRILRQAVADAVDTAAREGRIRPTMDGGTLARIVQAVTDGLQLQWLLEPEVDIAAIVGDLFAVLAPAANDPAPHKEPVPGQGPAPSEEDA